MTRRFNPSPANRCFLFITVTIMIISLLPSPARHRLLTVVVSLVLSVVPAPAACKVKAIFVQPPDAVPEEAVLVAGKKFLDIELPQRNFSPVVELPAGDLAVGVLPTKPAQSEMPVGAPSFKIPETWTNCILLFFHDPSNKVFPARIIPVNASSADFPLGHTLIFNVSPATVTAKFGNVITEVKPGQSVTVEPSRSGSGDYPVAIDCSYPGDKEPTALCRSTWQHEANARQILFVTPQPDQKTPRVWGVLDRQKEEPKKQN
jgi:hypothetical protein